METCFLVAGLGNPGAEYRGTRHNAGFLATDRVAERWRVDWEVSRSFQARLGRAAVGLRKVWLCQPQTFMNLSGDAVAAVAGYYRVPAERVLVVVDDADLPFGSLRLRASGSSGGHHGLESVESRLGTREYARLRIGIGREEPGIREITGHVLGRFGSSELPRLALILDRAADQIECWVVDGVGKAMTAYNGRVDPPEK